ncbi:MAG: hypothetical protein HKN49_11895 [Gammaproteobacteria bacterium]|nr:hypothetical protein [Gammaproteobacteria bacterium]
MSQSGDVGGVRDALNGSLDLEFGLPVGNGQWRWYIEASSDIRSNSIAARLPESNADAGSAVDPDNDGRIQLSEFSYTHRYGADTQLTVGLIDPSSFVDRSRVANDENSQFLGASFVNNPLIQFPDYTLGIFGEHSGWRALLTGSNGLADNAGLSYTELLAVTDDERGLFINIEKVFELSDAQVAVGGWHNGAEIARHDGSGRNETNHGAYINADMSVGGLEVNTRAGVANRKVSLADRFLAVSIARRVGDIDVGLGTATWFAADDGMDNATQTELYAAIPAGGFVVVSPSIQYLSNSGMGWSGLSSGWVFSLRLRSSLAQYAW